MHKQNGQSEVMRIHRDRVPEGGLLVAAGWSNMLCMGIICMPSRPGLLRNVKGVFRQRKNDKPGL